MKFVLLAILVLAWGGAQWAKADDEISCARGDNECVQGKVELGYKRFKEEERRERKRQRAKAGKQDAQRKAEEADEVPCAGRNDCQESKQDAWDRENGKTGQED